ncbi:MAG: glutaredoxin family protein [Chloroflexota bacterium]|nr:glutaredoxin family protein [Chloroflexota bacterium]
MPGRFPATTLRALLGGRRRPEAAPTKLTCYGKPDCSLCDKAKEPLTRALRHYGGRVTAEWVSILDDPTLVARWGERIPVICAGETVLAEGRVSELRLRRALDAFLQSGGLDSAADA